MLRLFLGAAIGGMAVPAAATDWASVAGWDVYEIDGTHCAVGRVFADARMSFGIIMSVDGETRVFATGAGWPTRTGQPIPVEVELDGKVLLAGVSVGIESQGNHGFVVAADNALLNGFSGANRLTVRAGDPGPSSTTALTGSAQGLAQGRRCVASLRQDRGIASPPAFRTRSSAPMARSMSALAVPSSAPPVRAIATRAIPRASLASWVGDTEYPAAALRARQEGATTVRIAIGREGSVGSCDIARSSGSPALDEETCRIFTRRGRYTPARDISGVAVASIEQQTIRWKLPD